MDIRNRFAIDQELAVAKSSTVPRQHSIRHIAVAGPFRQQQTFEE
jgi:hypothetical protein